MAIVESIDSSQTGLRFVEETSPNTLPGSPVWEKLEPNSYGTFGRSNSLTAREPINEDRMTEKGVVTDYDATGSWEQDLTQENLVGTFGEGLFRADIRSKDEITGSITADDTGDDFEVASGGDNYEAGDLLFAQGFSDDTNNGFHVVTGTPTATSIPVETDLTSGETASDATIRRVGYEFAADDLAVDASSTLPKLTTTTKDLTTLGINPGEWIYIGGDASTNQFTNAANNTWARVRSVATNEIVLDKANSTMVTETTSGGTTELRIFFASRVLKNESDPTKIVAHYYQLERTLGAKDDSSPSAKQAEYLTGWEPGEASISIPGQDKVTMNVSGIARDYEVKTSSEGRKSGTRPDLTTAAAFSTSSDIKRKKITKIDNSDENPTPRFAHVVEADLTINNNLTPFKAVANIGAFDVGANKLNVSGTLNAYFRDVALFNEITDNEDFTYDMIAVKSSDNVGWFLDLPLCSTSTDGAAVALNEPTTASINFSAHRATSVHSNFNHQIMMGWFDYLPAAAM